jgi:3'-phosphoadenosine 5'-phosphosulfate sulfotransferase (PAPS reductase)/FAD synthetase
MNQELKEKLAGRRVVASISGGKDSAALSLWLTEQGIEHDKVFMDTGWEHELTYEYLRGELTQKLGPIVEIGAVDKMEALVKRKGMFSSRVRRFCTLELKVFPMQKYLNARMDAGDDVINAVGIRNDESEARSKMAEWEWSDGFDCEVWRPLIKWTMDDVVAIHHRHGLRPNPLYLQGASRVGCWPCIFARKAEIRLVADIDPKRIERLRSLEAEVKVSALARYEKDKTAWELQPDIEPPSENVESHDRWEAKRARLTSPFQPPTWFQSQKRSTQGKYPTTPIDEAVTWSHTKRGGKEVEIFAPSSGDTGCMRWGLCETPKQLDLIPPEEK